MADYPTVQQRLPSFPLPPTCSPVYANMYACMVPPQVVAAFDYVGRSAEELSFHAGDLLTVTEVHSDDWFEGTVSSAPVFHWHERSLTLCFVVRCSWVDALD